MINIFIPQRPPTVNSMYKNIKKGRAKTPKYNAWVQEMGWKIKGKGKIHTPKYGLIIRINKPANADYSNYIKPIEDLLVTVEMTPDDKHNILTLCYGWEGEGAHVTLLNESEAKFFKELIEKESQDNKIIY